MEQVLNLGEHHATHVPWLAMEAALKKKSGVEEGGWEAQLQDPNSEL